MDNQSSGIFVGIISLLSLVVSIYAIIGYWKLYEKAGKPGWASLIPIYQVIVLFQIIGKPLWQLLLLFVPIIGWFYLWFTISINLCKSYGKTDTGSYILALFFGSIYLPYLGFAKEVHYVGPAESPTVPNNFGATPTTY